jgi:hypothetical protein
MNPADREVILHWYKEEDYLDVLAVMDDAATMPRRYEWWRRDISVRIETLRSVGLVPTPVHIDPDRFLHWCLQLNLRPDAQARDKYARHLITPKSDGSSAIGPGGEPQPDIRK